MKYKIEQKTKEKIVYWRKGVPTTLSTLLWIAIIIKILQSRHLLYPQHYGYIRYPNRYTQG